MQIGADDPSIRRDSAVKGRSLVRERFSVTNDAAGACMNLIAANGLLPARNSPQRRKQDELLSGG